MCFVVCLASTASGQNDRAEEPTVAAFRVSKDKIQMMKTKSYDDLTPSEIAEYRFAFQLAEAELAKVQDDSLPQSDSHSALSAACLNAYDAYLSESGADLPPVDVLSRFKEEVLASCN